ncbi:hypothetical protein [Pseudobacter ginsenosidimutans]|uniref:Uncharacterized protein n=1 Tax=Pseudobacter ginsenosidimutans TaxID=661488 RepID=A0A4Q7N4W5_9BACT|nr:hypothetical protein [Pseudobacter ginsenosidimutans]QEC44572.1 hypothetical protein FSB84_23910 [Pseudobacter ginsenosidimutans]RZS76051.1 hypothetical protein EV199_1928 [Pseudobacter ginsenosidimutans]
MAQNQSGNSKSLNRAKIQNQNSFERTRENLAEFNNVSETTRLIRNGFQSLIKSADPGRHLTGRLQKQLMEVLKTDSINDRGLRLVAKGNFGLMKDFEFNRNASLRSVLSLDFTFTVDRATGKFVISFPPFIPAKELATYQSATHFRLVTAGAELDIPNADVNVNIAQTEYIPIQKAEVTVANLENQLTANTQLTLMLVMSVEYYQEVNGKMYLLRADKRNPMKVIYAESAIV